VCETHTHTHTHTHTQRERERERERERKKERKRDVTCAPCVPVNFLFFHIGDKGFNV